MSKINISAEVEKKELLLHLSSKIETQIDQLKTEIISINEEMAQETKSSAGDKFETSREMMTQERNRLEAHVNQLKLQIRNILELNECKPNTLISYGSLVKTESNLFLFGISMGKISFQGNDIMTVSLNSPVGKAFQNKNVNEAVDFMNKSYHVLTIS